MRMTRAQRAAEIEDGILRKAKAAGRPLSGADLWVSGAGANEMVRALRSLERIGLLDKHSVVKNGRKQSAWVYVDPDKLQQEVDAQMRQR